MAVSPSARLIARLESSFLRARHEGEEVTLAFSGGLASLLLGAMARKGCLLRCVAVGLPGAPDLEAAAAAEEFLDYRVEVVRLSPPEVLRHAYSVAQRAPGLTLHEIASFIPLCGVLAKRPAGPILAGFGPAPLPPASRAYLRKVPVTLPYGQAVPVGIPRATLIAGARLLGLPDAFARIPRRPPGKGSGVWDVLRSLAKRQGRSAPVFPSSPEDH